MRVPPSFALAYLPEQAIAQQLDKIVGARLLTSVCQPNGWLFDGRTKSDESALAKMLYGPVDKLSKMNDLYAATVVVPTQKELSAAVAAVTEALPNSRVQKRKRGDAETFAYDDVHVIASLGESAPGLNEGLRSRRFEIQIHTGLQYAWWRATHEVIYKGGDRSWQLKRLASQIRASLEFLDAALADLRGAARLLESVEDEEDRLLKDVTKWLQRWPNESRPVDVVRFFNGVSAVASAANVDISTLERLLDSDSGSALVADTDVMPFQAVLGTAVTEYGPGVVDALPSQSYVLVTDEFRRACPVTEKIDSRRLARL